MPEWLVGTLVMLGLIGLMIGISLAWAALKNRAGKEAVGYDYVQASVGGLTFDVKCEGVDHAAEGGPVRQCRLSAYAVSGKRVARVVTVVRVQLLGYVGDTLLCHDPERGLHARALPGLAEVARGDQIAAKCPWLLDGLDPATQARVRELRLH